MLLQCWSIPTSSSSSAFHNCSALTHSGKNHNLVFKGPLCLRKPKASTPTCLRAQLLDQIAQVAHNKVLIAAGVSAAVGQLSKPFTSVILYGKDFDFKTTVQAGGFPSTHSSAVVATATSLGFERGLSDSIFGLTVVYASLVMYDAQGVRREVGNHARELNKILPEKSRVNSVPTKDRGRVNSQPKTSSSSLKLDSLGTLLSEEAESFSSKATNASLGSQSNNKMRQTSQTQMSSGLGTDAAEEGSERTANCSAPLKETIGHTEVEVTAGALLGFLVGLAVYTIM